MSRRTSKISKPSFEKKDITLETTDIGGFTLMFGDPEIERKWQLDRLPRHIRICQRFLLGTSISQALYFWSDIIESDGENVVYHLSLRLLISVPPLLGSFLVATGLLIPSQELLFFAELLYGKQYLRFFFIFI
jgi:hypothetical protein